MNLIWKLLRQHISIPQFAGFFFANLAGMFIILFGIQFYNDILPVFTSGDSFMKANYVIVSKKIGAAGAISQRTNTFSDSEKKDFEQQPFVKSMGQFTSASYRVEASMGVNGMNVLNSELFLESVPDKFVDAPKENWKYTEGQDFVPIILPRSYITMYNFGFAQSHSLPKLSEGLVGMIDFKIFIHGNGRDGTFNGRVIGFSNRLNSILVPQSFMDWSNKVYSSEKENRPTRLIIETDNPTDNRLAKYIDQEGYDISDNNMDAEKITYFLKMLVSIVMVVGLTIAALSFYILMLSIYLLVQKNSSKLENLLLIGYSPAQVARPYQLLTLCLNIGVLAIVFAALFLARNYYMDFISAMYPTIEFGNVWTSICAGFALLAIVSLVNIVVIKNKIIRIWHHHKY